MKTHSAPLHGSYFELLKDKYPDLGPPAPSRRAARRPRRRRRGRRPVAPVLLLAVAGVAWLAWNLRPAGSPLPEAAPPNPGEGDHAPLAAVTDASPAEEMPEAAAPDAEVPGEDARESLAPARTDAATLPEAPVESHLRPLPRPSRTPARPSRFAPPAEPAPALADAATPAPARLRPPRKVVAPLPEYPLGARQAGEEGTVVVAARVDASGAVTATEVVRGLSPALDRAAAETLARWRFEPALRDGQPVASSYRVGFQFALEPAASEPEAPDRGGPQPAAHRTPLEIGGDVRPPRRLSAPLPSYPDEAWAEGVTGDVLVRAVIDERGTVAEIEVLKGLPYGMTEAALEAIRRWKFAPATLDGAPVAVYRNLSVRFDT